MVEAKKSALLRSEDGGKTWKSVNDEAERRARGRSTSATCGSIPRGRTASTASTTRSACRTTAARRSGPCGATGTQIHGDYHAHVDRPRTTRPHLHRQRRRRGGQPRPRRDLPLRRQPAARAVLPRGGATWRRPYNVYGGLQDNGSWRGPSTVWQAGGIRNYHWRDGRLRRRLQTSSPITDDPTRGYSLWQGGNLMRWDLRTGETRAMKPAPPEGDQAALQLERRAGHRSLRSGRRLPRQPVPAPLQGPRRDLGDDQRRPDHRTTRSGRSRTTSGGLTPDVTAAENFTTIIAIAPSALERGVIWVGTDDGRVHVTRDGGATWTLGREGHAGRPGKHLGPAHRPSRHDAGEAFVVFDNHRRSDWKPYVYRTDDYGRSWTSLAAADIAATRWRSTRIRWTATSSSWAPSSGSTSRATAGESWTHLEKTLPTASVMDLAIHPARPRPGGRHPRPRGLDPRRHRGRCARSSAATLDEPLHLYEIAAGAASTGSATRRAASASAPASSAARTGPTARSSPIR